MRAITVVSLLVGCGPGPARKPVVAVTVAVPAATQPRCDGTFNGRVDVAATWPAGRGATLQTRLGVTNTQTNVVVTTLDSNEFTLTDQHARETLQLQGNLQNLCNPGTVTARAQGPILSAANEPKRVDVSNTGTIRAVGFLIPALETRQPGQAQIGTTFLLACCPGAAGQFTVDWPASINVNQLAPPPPAPALNCPAAPAPPPPPQKIVLDGNKQRAQEPATIVLRITDGAGNACTLPIPFE